MQEPIRKTSAQLIEEIEEGKVDSEHIQGPIERACVLEKST